MKIPYAGHAEVDIRKLKDYCLNPVHPEGKHKARLFNKVFGITDKDSNAIRKILLKKIRECEAKIGRRDDYGQRYIVDFDLRWREKKGVVRSAWIIEHGSDTPRLTSCYPL